jgi:murein L,D-transpeptidase YafK
MGIRLAIVIVWLLLSPAHAGEKADFVLVEKAERRMTLLSEGRALKTYRIALGFNPVGHKQYDGDGRTPEGRYILDWRNPRSYNYLSIHVGYPRPDQVRAARKLGVRPGGDIMIHGIPPRYGWSCAVLRYRDWTAGCIAVCNHEMDEIWRLVPNGTPIEIRP